MLNNQKKINESGRSMIEILSVLAIVGVLSVLGLYMFVLLLYIAREHTTVETINQATVGAVTGLAEKKLVTKASEKIPAEQIVSGVSVDVDGKITTPLGIKIYAYLINGETGIETATSKKDSVDEDYLEVHLDNVTYNVCKRYLTESANYQSAYVADKRYLGLKQGASNEEIERFCREAVDTYQRSPTIQEPRENPDANMILCYANNKNTCQLADKVDRSCKVGFSTYENGASYFDCGICDEGAFEVDGSVTPPDGYECGVFTGFKNQLK